MQIPIVQKNNNSSQNRRTSQWSNFPRNRFTVVSVYKNVWIFLTKKCYSPFFAMFGSLYQSFHHSFKIYLFLKFPETLAFSHDILLLPIAFSISWFEYFGFKFLTTSTVRVGMKLDCFQMKSFINRLQ